MAIFLYDIETHGKTKTVIKRRFSSTGGKVEGNHYVVVTLADVTLKDFKTLREARAFCKNTDKVLIVLMRIAIRKMLSIYWSGVRDLKTDAFMHAVENDLDNME